MGRRCVKRKDKRGNSCLPPFRGEIYREEKEEKRRTREILEEKRGAEVVCGLVDGCELGEKTALMSP